MVAEAGVELDTGVEQRLVRPLELLQEVFGPLAAVHVVAQHDHEIKRKLLVPGVHLAGNVVLRPVAGAVVAHGREFHRTRPIGKRQLLGEECRWKERSRDTDGDTDGDEKPPHSVYLSAFCLFIRHSIGRDTGSAPRHRTMAKGGAGSPRRPS